MWTVGQEMNLEAIFCSNEHYLSSGEKKARKKKFTAA